ncbi:MAG: hypothetical protein CUN54_08675 [Phototrophicales bacterium]|nr:MAG: hypothetical protein CUN54_08675 [Phototrophicales bacterium]
MKTVRKVIRQPDGIVIAAYTIIIIVMTWPLLLHFDTHILGPFKTDNFELLWKMWWVPHAVFEQGQNPFLVPTVYYPSGYELVLGELTPLHTFLLAPLTWLTNEVVTYNVSFFVSAPLSGWLVYRLAQRWLSALAPENKQLVLYTAFFAGAAFAFSAYRIQKGIGGHLNLIPTQFVILAFLGLDRWLDERRLRDVVLAGLGFALGALSSWYYLYIPLLILPIYLLLRVGSLTTFVRDRRTWLAALIVAMIVGGLVIPFALPYLRFDQTSDGIPLGQASFWSASPIDYLLPNPGHPLWGGLVQRVLWPFPGDMPLEFMIPALDLVTLIFGVWAWRRLEGQRWRALRWSIIAAFLLSLGPVFHLSRLPLGVPMPAALVRLILPGADNLRTWGRFSLFVTFGMSLMAAGGLLLWLREATPNRQRISIVIAVVALLFINWGGSAELVDTKPRPVDLWLNEQPDDFAVMQYPIESALTGSSVFYARFHNKPIIYATGTFFNLQFVEQHSDIVAFPDSVAQQALLERDVRYVLVDTTNLEEADFTLEDVERQSWLRHIITLGEQQVYEILPT